MFLLSFIQIPTLKNIIFATDTMKIACTCSDGTYTLLNWKERQSNTFITQSGLAFNPWYFNDCNATGGKTNTERRQIVPEQDARVRGQQTDLIMEFVLSHTLLDVKTTTEQNVFRNNFNICPQKNLLVFLYTFPKPIKYYVNLGYKRDISCFWNIYKWFYTVKVVKTTN